MKPSEIFLEIYNYLKGIVKSTETPVKSLVISFLVYTIKEFFKENLFICPIQNHRAYGNLFIFGPAVVLFCISLLVSESFWHLTTGVCCCRRIIWSKSRKSIYLAILPPIIWLILVFADTHYYVCAKVGPVKTAKSAANSTAAMEALELKISNARTESQIIAWALLISLVSLATLALTIDRCVSSPKSEIVSKTEFENLEASYAVDMFNKKIMPMAESQAKETVKNLFDLYKNEKPDDLVLLGEGYLTAVYPNYGVVGNRHLCMADMPKEKRASKFSELFKKRQKRDEEVEVGLTESGPQQQYTSIN